MGEKMKRLLPLLMIVVFIFLVTGCGQTDFAEVEKRGYFYEEFYEEEFATLGLDVQVKNLTGDMLYIEGSAVGGESGEKQILFSLVSDQGDEYKPQYYDVEGVSLLPAEIEPDKKAKGYVVFTELPADWSVVTLTVKQRSAGDKDGKVIFTEEITKESVSS